MAPEEGIAGIPGNMFGAAAPGQPGTIAGSAAGAAGALAGWAYSSISKKVLDTHPHCFLRLIPLSFQLAASDLQTPITSSGPPPTNGATRPPIQPSLSTLSSPDVHAPTRPAGAKAMQLGAAKMPTSALAAELEREAAASAGVPGGWGDGDLMDVHADEGDWTGFVGARPGGAAGTPNLGFEDFSAPAAAADDEWGALDDNAGEGQGDVDPWAAPPPPAYPSLSTQTRKPAAAASLAPRAPATPAKQLRAQTPVSSPPSQDVSRVSSPVPPAAAGSAAAPSMAGMTKEEKAAEMARRKEERKQVRFLCLISRRDRSLTGMTANRSAEGEEGGREVMSVVRWRVSYWILYMDGLFTGECRPYAEVKVKIQFTTCHRSGVTRGERGPAALRWGY